MLHLGLNSATRVAETVALVAMASAASFGSRHLRPAPCSPPPPPGANTHTCSLRSRCAPSPGVYSVRSTENSLHSQHLRLQTLFNCTRDRQLRARNPQSNMQLVEKQARGPACRLEPLAVNHQLRNGALAHVALYLFRGCRSASTLISVYPMSWESRNCLAARQSRHHPAV